MTVGASSVLATGATQTAHVHAASAERKLSAKSRLGNGESALMIADLSRWFFRAQSVLRRPPMVDIWSQIICGHRRELAVNPVGLTISHGIGADRSPPPVVRVRPWPRPDRRRTSRDWAAGLNRQPGAPAGRIAHNGSQVAAARRESQPVCHTASPESPKRSKARCSTHRSRAGSPWLRGRRKRSVPVNQTAAAIPDSTPSRRPESASKRTVRPEAETATNVSPSSPTMPAQGSE